MVRLLRTTLARTLGAAPAPGRIAVGWTALLALSLALGLVASTSAWYGSDRLAESESVEFEGGEGESTASDPLEEVFATCARPRLRHRRLERLPVVERATSLDRVVDDPPPRAGRNRARRVESGRERLIRHQSFLI
ncbi:MAG: hypothetical protein R3F35_10950 [Myxococcota bacterium]